MKRGDVLTSTIIFLVCGVPIWWLLGVNHGVPGNFYMGMAVGALVLCSQYYLALWWRLRRGAPMLF